MWAIFLKGGFIMFPLGFLSVLGVAVVIEKIINLRNAVVGKVRHEQMTGFQPLPRFGKTIKYLAALANAFSITHSKITGIRQKGHENADI